MKEILKIMRFDLLTVGPAATAGFVFAAVLFSLMGLIFSPVLCSYVTFCMIIFIMPLQSVADKSDFNKLYGILPVHRKNITRARFLYIFLLFFTAEIFECILAGISLSLKLFRLLPNQNGEFMQMLNGGFNDTKSAALMIIAAFVVCCLIFSYIEMMGLIFGRENEFKIIVLTLIAITVICVGFFNLSNRGIIPMIRLSALPYTEREIYTVGAVLNAVLLGLCILFGEITANKLSKREL